MNTIMTEEGVELPVFRTVLFGYSKADIAEYFVKAGANALQSENVLAENRELKLAVLRLKDELKVFNDQKLMMADLLIEAKVIGQEMIDEVHEKESKVLNDAKIKAAQMVHEAKEEAERIINAAKASSESMVAEAKAEYESLIDETKNSSLSFVKDARDEAAKILDTAKASSESMVTKAKDTAESIMQEMTEKKDRIENDLNEKRREFNALQKKISGIFDVIKDLK